ncbi:MAG: hypothetical protein IT223_10280, partial [Crocinitomicaceae bacterium]|nr:hypothetical protein [Crocinitomicaceae bacterium]
MTVFTGALQARCWTGDPASDYTENGSELSVTRILNKAASDDEALTCNAEIGQLSIHNLSTNANTALTNGGSYPLSSFPANWNVEAQVTGSSAQSVKFTFSGSFSSVNIDNGSPYRAVSENTPLNLGVGSYTLNVKVYSADNAGGYQCDQKTISFTITGPVCTLSVDAGQPQSTCFPAQLTLNATTSGAASCEIPGTSDCNHTVYGYGGYVANPATAGVCGDNAGAKIWTQGGQGTAFLTVDFGVSVPEGTQICVRMKLEHCGNSSSSSSNAKIQASQNPSSNFVDLTSSVLFSQTTYQDFCYTLSSAARYIKITDNGQCSIRIDYVTYNIPPSSGGTSTYLWTGPGIIGPNNLPSINVNQPGTYVVVVTDCAGCTATDSVVITGDSTPPVFGNNQAQYSLSCGESIPLIQPTATDNNGAVSYSYVDTHTCTSANSYCNCTHVRVWTATDLCNNTATFTQSFTYLDNIAPVLQNVPSDYSAQCGEVPAPANVTATDNCDSNVQVDLQQHYSSEHCPLILTRTWTATDDCGNSVSATQTISIDDTIAPVLVGVPADASIECGEEIADAAVSATDNCSQGLEVGLNVETEGMECGYLIIRTWTVSDNCGNQASAQQVITVIDTTKPVLHNVPSDYSAECGEVPSPDVVTATDNCDEEVAVDYNEEVVGDDCPVTLVRTWTATDHCGNSTSASQSILISDTQAPVLVGVPQDATVECSNVPAPAPVTADDNCAFELEVSFYQDSLPNQNGCGYTLIRHWSVSDYCNNTATASQVLTVTDTTKPVIQGVPSDMSAECSSIPEPAVVT